LTTELKQATDSQAKLDIIEKVRNEEIFHQIRQEREQLKTDENHGEARIKDEIEELKKIFYVFFVEGDQ